MSNAWPWFERTFDNQFPDGKMPEISERLRGTPLRLRALLEGPSTSALQFRARPNTWSALENAGHLSDLEPLWSLRMEDILNGVSPMREADLTNQATHQASHHDSTPEALAERFENLRRQWISRIEGLAPLDWGATSIHPRLGTPMRIADLCHFVAEHDDYHLTRIRYLLATFQENND